MFDIGKNCWRLTICTAMAAALYVGGSGKAVAANPVGYHDTAACTSTQGWTCDPDNYAQQIAVHFYASNADGSNFRYVGQTVASTYREDAVKYACGNSHNYHGFNWTLPASVKTGTQQKLYAYAINNVSGTNPVLNNSPKTIQCGTAPPPPTSSVLGVGTTRVYQNSYQTWVVSRINSSTITFVEWDHSGANWIGYLCSNKFRSASGVITSGTCPAYTSGAKLWRSDSRQGVISSESSTAITYGGATVGTSAVNFWSAGVHASPFGVLNGPYEFYISQNSLYHRWPGQASWVWSGNKVAESGAGSAMYSKQWLACGQEGVNAVNPGWTFVSYWAVKAGPLPQPAIWVGFAHADEGLESLQGTVHYSASGNYEVAVSANSCTAWTSQLGFCQYGRIGPGGVEANYNFATRRWWTDNACVDNIPNCNERNGRPHGTGVNLTDRYGPTNAHSSYSASVEGPCP